MKTLLYMWRNRSRCRSSNIPFTLFPYRAWSLDDEQTWHFLHLEFPIPLDKGGE